MSTIIMILSLVACKQNNQVDNVITEVGESTKFNEEEVKEALDTVKNRFGFKGCTLKKVWYDEEKSDYAASGYLGTGKGSVNGVKAENVIVVLSEFDVDSSGGDGSFQPNSTYDNWQFILIRDDKESDWEINDWGY